MGTILESNPRHAGAPADAPDPASPTAWRARLAAGAVAAALLLMALGTGGSLYEHLVVDPAWPGNVAVIQPEHGGVNRELFWVPLHAALTLALPLALWAAWRNVPARRWLLAAAGSYVAMRVWTLVY